MLIWRKYFWKRHKIEESLTLIHDYQGQKILKIVTRPTAPNVSNAMVNLIINIGKIQNVYSSCNMRHSPWLVDFPALITSYTGLEYYFYLFEPPHEKTNKMTCVCSKESDLAGWMPRLIWVFAGRKGHFVGFVMRWLICSCFYQLDLEN